MNLIKLFSNTLLFDDSFISICNAHKHGYYKIRKTRKQLERIKKETNEKKAKPTKLIKGMFHNSNYCLKLLV